jgi:hypothetical protein
MHCSPSQVYPAGDDHTLCFLFNVSSRLSMLYPLSSQQPLHKPICTSLVVACWLILGQPSTWRNCPSFRLSWVLEKQPANRVYADQWLIDFTWKIRHSDVTWCRPMTNGKGLVDRCIQVLSISRSSTCHLKRDPSTDTCSMGWIARRTNAIYLGILRSFAACIG